MATDVVIRPSNEGDREAILTLAGLVFGESPARVMREQWQWQWQLDPRLEVPGHVGVVAECGRDIVASTALQPAGLCRAGRPVSAWWSVDTMVHPEFRRRGIAERMFTTMLGVLPDAVVLGKGISAPALPMLQKCGFELFDTGGYWQRTIDLAPQIARWLGRWLAVPLSRLPNALVCALPPAPSQVVEFDGPFDERFDRLWGEVSAAQPAITRRDAVTLNWRYQRHPLHAYRVLVVGAGQRLRGYVVFRLFERRRCLRARVCDLLTTADASEVRAALLTAVLHAARSAGADRVDCFASDSAVHDCLRRLGFAPSLDREPLAARGIAAKGLYVTAGDGDGA